MSATKTMQVVDGYAGFHDGRHHIGGETLELPADLAEQWTRRGFVQTVDKPRRAPRKRTT